MESQLDQMRISLVIPSLNPSEKLVYLLQSIQKQNLGSLLEVIVVLNGDSKSDFRYPGVELLKSPKKKNVSAARNMGMLHSTGQWIYLLDDDCELPKEGFLLDLLAIISSGSPLNVYFGPYLDASSQNSVTRMYNQICNTWLSKSGPSDQPCVLGGNVIFHRQMVNVLFDESISFGGEEREWALRLHYRGAQLRFLDSMGIYHRPHSHLLTHLKKALRQGYAKGMSTHTPSRGKKYFAGSLQMRLLIFIYLSAVAWGWFLGRIFGTRKIYAR